jgi:hypothetical protein
MRKLMLSLVAAGGLWAAGGCAAVTSSTATFSNVTGEAWYTEGKGFAGYYWATKVFYCPPPASGPATCKEAKMIALTKEEVQAQENAEKAASGK